MSTVTSSVLSGQYQSFYYKVALERQIQETRLAEFGYKNVLPADVGAKQVKWARWNNPDGTTVGTITEGTLVSASRDLSLTFVTSALTQYGSRVLLTDILQDTELYRSIDAASDTLGKDAAEHLEQLTRNELVENSDSSSERYPASLGTKTFAGLSAATVPEGTVTMIDALDSATQLKVNRAPEFGSSKVGYVWYGPPQIMRDLQRDATWIDAHKYASQENLFKGELGEMYGVRFVQGTLPYREDNSAQNTYAASGPIYSSLIMGRQAFGITDLSKQPILKPKLMVVQGADKYDSMDQLTIVSWKGYWAAKILNAAFYVHLRSKTNYA